MGSIGWLHEAVETAAVEPFGYPEESAPRPTCQEWSLIELDLQGNPIQQTHQVAPRSAAAEAEFERRLIEETRRNLDAAVERGRQEGRALEREAQRAAHAGDSERIAEELARLNDSFVAQRDHYMERLEHEAVKLALSVAARILRREAQMDPLFLLGAVRVAMGQLAASTQVRVHVPAAHADLWREAVALLPNRTLKPQVVSDDEMRLGDCALETDLGSVDLGVRAQLGEIERGFFDSVTPSILPEEAAVVEHS
jgi:flagellar assembly protein FliH